MVDFTKLIDKKDQYAEFMADQIATVCNDYPARSAGSENEVKTAEFFAETLKTQCGCDDVTVDKFKVHPQALTSWVYLAITCFVLGIISFFFIPVLGVILHVFGIVAMTLQYVLRLKAFDKICFEGESANVSAWRKCSGEVKGRVIFNGHLDANWNHAVNTKIGGKGHAILVILSLVGAVVSLALCLGATIVSECYAGLSSPVIYGAGIFYAGVASVAFVPVMIVTYYAVDEKKVVDGANELTGATLSVALLKALNDENLNLENIELGVFLTGSKNAGHRGAKELCNKHQDDFYDVPTLLYTFDNIHSTKDLQVCYKDMHGFVSANEFIADLMVEAGEDLGVDMRPNKVMSPLGATDAGAFRQGKFMSVAITGINPMDEKCYNTVLDTVDTIDKGALADCFQVAIKCLDKVDAVLQEEEEHHHCDDPNCSCHHHHE